MQFLNATVDRIIIHQIYKKNKDEMIKKAPDKSTNFTNFEVSAMNNFKQRFDEAIGENSKAVEMLLNTEIANPLYKIVEQAIHDSDDDYISTSFEVTKKLDQAQKKASESGGIIVVFSGKCNYPARDFLGIIKAEIHSGYRKIEDINTKKISLEFLKEVLLTPGTKLYKTAAFLKKKSYDATNTDPNLNWEVWISDNQVSKAEGKAGSDYFLNTFLGFTYPETSARKTNSFYNETMRFINSIDITDEQKNNYLNALTTYLKVDKSNIINPIEFSEKYLDIEHKSDYIDHLEDRLISKGNFVKDISEMTNKLKFRKLSFTSNISISGAPEDFKKKVSFRSIDGDEDDKGNIPIWTEIIVKDEILSQE